MASQCVCDCGCADEGDMVYFEWRGGVMDKTVFVSGATSSTEKPRYDLVPPVALRRLAERFGYGARKHGDHNYKQGFNDAEFIRDRINHMIEHAVKFASGDRSTDHLGAVMCNAAMLTELERLAENHEIDRQFGINLHQPEPDRDSRAERLMRAIHDPT